MRAITCMIEGRGISNKTKEARGCWSKEKKERAVIELEVGGEKVKNLFSVNLSQKEGESSVNKDVPCLVANNK